MVAPDGVRPEAEGLVVKVGAVVSETVRVKVVALVVPPPVAVMVITAGPRGADGWVVRVRVEKQLGEQETGEKETVAPMGRPETEKVNEAGVPFTRVAVMMLVTELP